MPEETFVFDDRDIAADVMAIHAALEKPMAGILTRRDFARFMVAYRVVGNAIEKTARGEAPE